jgi:hypothetical protein
VRAVPVARKLSTIEESREDESCFEEEIAETKARTPKTVLRSIPGEDNFCCSEIRHDRRAAPRTKLFVSKRRLQEQRSQPRKTVLGSIPGEDGFCCSDR